MPRDRRLLTDRNRVRGHPDWTYGLRIRNDHGVLKLDGRPSIVTFDVFRDDGAKIEGLTASGYRTTTLARKMGVRDLPGYQTCAAAAIRRFEATERALTV